MLRGARAPDQFRLMSADRWEIPNVQVAPPVSALALEATRFWLRDTLSRAKALAGPSSRYNCFGLVFASRRTNVNVIPDAECDVRRLLARDGYHVTQEPQVGNIVTYARGTDGPIDHVGFVSNIDQLGVVWVWSMWGALGEFEHREKDCPFHALTVGYWRIVA